MLTPRELDIARLVAQGKQNKEIAWQLAISEQTVKNHLSRAARKLHAQNRVAVALWVIASQTSQTSHAY